MTMNTELMNTVREKMEKNPSTMTGDLARSLSVKEVEIIRCLPEGMAVEALVEDFETIWERMTTWEKATFICISKGCVVEVAGPLPVGKHGHGMFNLHQEGNPLGGHLMVKDLGSIWLVSKPFFGKESHSVQFFSQDGDAMFSVYLGRDEQRNIIESVKNDFLEMKEQYEKKEK